MSSQNSFMGYAGECSWCSENGEMFLAKDLSLCAFLASEGVLMKSFFIHGQLLCQKQKKANLFVLMW